MRPNRVPEDLLEAGSDAIRAWYAAHPSPNAYLDDRTQMRIVLAAVLTLHNEQVEQPLRERAEVAEAVLVEHEEAKALLERLRSPEIADYDSQLLARWISKAIGHGMEAAKLRAELAEVRVAHDSAVGAWSAQQDIIQAERRRAETAERELAELRERIGKGEIPDSHCPWCGMAMWLNADGLAPLHDHPVNGGRCPGIGRRPSDQWRDGEWEGAEEPWIDCGDGWKVRRPTADLSGLRGPFTGLLGPFGLHGDGNEVVADDAGDPS